MTGTWEPSAPGVLRLPSGRLVRGRGLKRPLPEGPEPQFPSGRLVRGRGLKRPLPEGPEPQFALYLLGREPAPVDWESRWIKWPDFRLPADPEDFGAGLREAWDRAGRQRVEFACAGGQGRTGTALSCLAILDGVPAPEAIAYVREHYLPHAVETSGQRKFIENFRP